MAEQYPIRVVSRMTGLSVDTLRAWERRYQAVVPVRSARGRVYEDADVQRFVQLRNLVGRGFAISEVARLRDSELRELLNRAHDEGSKSSYVAEDWGLKGILAAVESFDSARMNEELGRMAALMSPAEFVHEVAVPVMIAVGERWHAGSMQTAHEHLATESIRNLLGTMVRMNRPGGAQPRILAATPAGELHEVGIMAASVLAGQAGYDVASLGPNLPADQILYAVQRLSPQILMLGMSTPDPSSMAIETVREIAARMSPKTDLWLGGAGAAIALNDVERPGTVLFEHLRAMQRELAERRREWVS